MKLLALDGGGVFGRVQAKILADANAWGKFDAFCGTSIGSAIAAAGALGLQDRVGPEFFDASMPRVFYRSWLRRLNVIGSKYSDKGLNAVLRETFKGALLTDCRKPLFITAVDIDRQRLKVFSSTDTATDDVMPMWSAIRASTSAPTYFDAWQGYCDGGIFANNPAMVGVAAVSKVLKYPLNQIEVFSIGTGIAPETSGSNPRNVIGWGRWLIPSVLHGAASGMHDYFCRSLPLRRYVRVQFIRDSKWRLDDVDAMKTACEKWKDQIEAGVEALRAF
jgi:patatin-like phospholipase/acyl hydrolase